MLEAEQRHKLMQQEHDSAKKGSFVISRKSEEKSCMNRSQRLASKLQSATPKPLNLPPSVFASSARAALDVQVMKRRKAASKITEKLAEIEEKKKNFERRFSKESNQIEHDLQHIAKKRNNSANPHS